MATKGDAGRSSRCTYRLNLLLTALIVGLFLLAVVLQSFCFMTRAKAAALWESYLAAHVIPGNLKKYATEENLDRVFENLPIAAGVFGGYAIALALFRERLARFLCAVPSEWAGICKTIRSQLPSGTVAAFEMGSVFAVLLFGIFLRVWHLGRAIRYDEAWSYIDFASKPLVLGLSNYRVPNNQLLNTLLVHFSTRVLGNTVFGLRFPALAAGSLAIVASWFVARRLYGQVAAIMTPGCIAAFPAFIEFSINARGYALQWLFILAALWCAAELRVNPSLKNGWLGLCLASIAGIYAIPTTSIAVAGVFGWIFISTRLSGESGGLKVNSKRLAWAGLAIVMLSLLLYLPPLLFSGPRALIHNESVSMQQGEFVPGLKHMGQCAWAYWTEGVPAGVLWVLAAGLVVGALFHRRASQHGPSMTLVLVIFAGVFVCVCRVFAFPRTWSYLLLCAIMTACAGLSLVLELVAGRSRIRPVALAGFAAAALAVVTGTEIIRQRVLFTTNETGTIVDADRIVDYLSAELHPGDALVANAIVDYELLRRQPKLYDSLAKPQEATHVIAVAYKPVGEADLCNSAVAIRMLSAINIADPATLSRQIDFTRYSPPQAIAKFQTSTAFSLRRRE